ncbi:hypothetical protein [Mesorhizobium sp. SEMIA 3007]|uniref:hypothetical protein n=1 Tax=Mesorhizobium sp. SEMIA 3007 TaxID=1862350 RepID=UPI00114CB447|nr:hypothetical protein [Mesorhizobium sp. SEMIA 3007]
MVTLSPNHSLSSLTPEAFEFLRPHLRTVESVQGAVLVEGGGEIFKRIFPMAGSFPWWRGSKRAGQPV